MIFSPFWRQFYVALSPLFAGISAGGAVSFPTVLLQQLQANDTSIQLDFETASWMGSIHGIAGIPSIFMPSLMQWKGRKIASIVICIVTIIGWLVAYFATDATSLLISESIHGFGTNSLLVISSLTITEMMSPKYRDTFMFMFYIVETVGMATEGLLVQHYHWRTISIIMLMPMVISLLVACTIPESPYWLAYKGDFSLCEKNFVWLRGADPASKKELNDLIYGSKENINSFGIESIKHFCEKITGRDFYIPAVHVIVLGLLIYGSGSIVTLIYIIVMLQKSTSNANITAYGSFIMNSIVCVGMCIGVALDRNFKKKSVLLCSISGATLSLITASAFAYCQSVGVWSKESLAGLYCLSLFMLFSSVGIMGLAYSIAAALMPVKNRGLGGALMIITTGVFHTVSLKTAPYMFLYLNMWGTYLVYGALCLSCGMFIWKYVPEIKDRTLQEIENYYLNGAYSRNNLHDVELRNTIPKIVCESEMQLLNS